jgi:hypothetical protein
VPVVHLTTDYCWHHEADREQAAWEQRLWHPGHQTFACQPDAEAALAKARERLPP